MERTQGLTCWSDAGTHFRSLSYVGSLINRVCEGKRRFLTMRFLAEAHGKGRCDSQFGMMGKAIEDERHIRPLSTVEDTPTGPVFRRAVRR